MLTILALLIFLNFVAAIAIPWWIWLAWVIKAVLLGRTVVRWRFP